MNRLFHRIDTRSLRPWHAMQSSLVGTEASLEQTNATARRSKQVPTHRGYAETPLVIIAVALQQLRLKLSMSGVGASKKNGLAARPCCLFARPSLRVPLFLYDAGECAFLLRLAHRAAPSPVERPVSIQLNWFPQRAFPRPSNVP